MYGQYYECSNLYDMILPADMGLFMQQNIASFDKSAGRYIWVLSGRAQRVSSDKEPRRYYPCQSGILQMPFQDENDTQAVNNPISYLIPRCIPIPHRFAMDQRSLPHRR